jgi:hypothetical protein
VGSAQGRIPSAVSGGPNIEFANAHGNRLLSLGASCSGARQITRQSRATSLGAWVRQPHLLPVTNTQPHAEGSDRHGDRIHQNEPARRRQGAAGSPGALGCEPTCRTERAHPIHRGSFARRSGDRGMLAGPSVSEAGFTLGGLLARKNRKVSPQWGHGIGAIAAGRHLSRGRVWPSGVTAGRDRHLSGASFGAGKGDGHPDGLRRPPRVQIRPSGQNSCQEHPGLADRAVSVAPAEEPAGRSLLHRYCRTALAGAAPGLLTSPHARTTRALAGRATSTAVLPPLDTSDELGRARFCALGHFLKGTTCRVFP